MLCSMQFPERQNSLFQLCWSQSLTRAALVEGYACSLDPRKWKPKLTKSINAEQIGRQPPHVRHRPSHEEPHHSTIFISRAAIPGHIYYRKACFLSCQRSIFWVFNTPRRSSIAQALRVSLKSMLLTTLLSPLQYFPDSWSHLFSLATVWCASTNIRNNVNKERLEVR